MKARHGVKGLITYVWLLCEIYKNGYYLKLDDDYEYLISEELNIRAGEIKQIIKFLLERSMFDNKLFQSDNVITSPGIQRRFQLAVKRKTPLIVDKFWILSEEETQSSIKVTHFSKNDLKNDEKSENCDTIKEKNKNKIKENKINNNCRAEAARQNSLINQIIDYLNQKTGKNFKAGTELTKRHINARLNDGFNLDDFKRVIDIKTEQWLNNTEMNKYLRPSTLFASKFESYLNENIQSINDKPERIIDDNSSDFKNWSDKKLDDFYNSLH